ncbi:MAG: hypothetical protein FJX78_08300 [Armatimonadetes bacterium]|nr:hypothetical protein [Armatimonadota bacterium]
MKALARVSLVVFAAAAASAAVWTWDARAHEGRIFPNVFIDDVHVGGLSAGEATRLVSERASRRLGRSVSLRAGATFSMPAERLGLRVDIAAVARRALAVGRTGSIVDRLRSRWTLLRDPARQALSYEVDQDRLRGALTWVTKQVGTKPENARLTVVDGLVQIVPGRYGIGVDPTSTAPAVARALLAGEQSIDLPLATIAPPVTAERLRAIRISQIVATYTTRFPNVPNRNFNIGLAARALRGRLLDTGQTLSFNDAVGPRTRAAGYLEAPVIINDEFVPGDGGGVCQVSSTLFNAAALAGLKIEERSNHSSPVAYLPIGRDATVVYGYLDLKVRNEGAPLLLWAEVVGRTLTISFYGAPRSGVEQVAVATSNIETLPAPAGVIERRDRDLPVGTVKVIKARSGFRVTTWRVVHAGGGGIRREVIACSFYRPVAEIRRIGTRPVEQSEGRPPPASESRKRRVFP